jgi:hypothetical protein
MGILDSLESALNNSGGGTPATGGGWLNENSKVCFLDVRSGVSGVADSSWRECIC